jgi:hypothetical protein
LTYHKAGLLLQYPRKYQAKKVMKFRVLQSSKLGGSPKPVACKIVHGGIKSAVPQVRHNLNRIVNF